MCHPTRKTKGLSRFSEETPVRTTVAVKTTFGMLIALFCLVIAGRAQQGRGTIFGTVTDSSGAAVNGAKVTILTPTTNTPNKPTSNGEGYCPSPPLLVGNYEVDVEQPGFKKEIRRGIVLQVDQHAQINVQLQIGAVGESVQVTAEAPLVNTE